MVLDIMMKRKVYRKEKIDGVIFFVGSLDKICKWGDILVDFWKKSG